MGIFRTFIRSADLVNGMTQRLGLDLASRLARDPESEAQRLKQMITRCAACRAHVACAQLQAQEDSLAACPAYCQNRAAFAVLAD